MGFELATWRPLFEFSMILVVLGLAGCLSSRDRVSWWLAQGLLLLGLILGLAATEAMHPRVDLFSLGMWVPLVMVAELIICVTARVSLGNHVVNLVSERSDVKQFSNRPDSDEIVGLK